MRASVLTLALLYGDLQVIFEPDHRSLAFWAVSAPVAHDPVRPALRAALGALVDALQVTVHAPGAVRPLRDDRRLPPDVLPVLVGERHAVAGSPDAVDAPVLPDGAVPGALLLLSTLLGLSGVAVLV